MPVEIRKISFSTASSRHLDPRAERNSRFSKPKAHDELAPPGMGEVGQVGELSGNFQPNCDALISAGNIDAAAHAGADGAAANNGKFNDSRLDQPADAENAETVG